MKFSRTQRRRVLAGLLLGVVLGVTLAGLHAYLRGPDRGLPYRDSFAKGKADEWKALGGTWELINGMMRNDSDERGAKLLTGSPYWHNYSIEADVSLLGISGDAGVVIRSGNEEEGVNSYSGYYAGIRTLDDTLVLGRAEHGWMEVNKRSAALGSVRPFQWYHLKLLAYDCQIAASVTAPSRPSSTVLSIADPECIQTGRVGLRSYSSGGIWRNIVVRPITHEDVAEVLQSAGGQRDSGVQNRPTEDAELLGPRTSLEHEKARTHFSATTQSIASLRLTSYAKPVIATVRGVVVLTTPLLFVQDSTGGVYVPQPKSPLLKVGDEVEVTGEVHPGDFSSTMEQATVQVL